MAGSARPGFEVVGVVAIAAALALGVMQFFTVLGSPHDVGGKDVAYISGDEVNIRRCPSVKCESTATYHRQQQVVITDDDVEGSESHGSRRWLEIQYGDEVRYVHSYFVEQESDSLAKSVELIVSIAACLVAVMLLSLLRWQRGQSWAATKEHVANSVLAAGTFVCGLVVGIAAFLVARADGQSRAAFLSSALANVGAGLVGAAVTFVLFQAFLSRRTPSRDQVAELQAQLSALQAVIDRPETRTESSATSDRQVDERSNRPRVLATALATALVGWILYRTGSGRSDGATRRAGRNTKE